ncbi:hypothetical protein BC830DRAFT_1173540 [Chytriomyces sp. MP71]|nr:hypothetical protein BC830DRAFT_1174357 [Chytriomyces sp. MP71]KAI8609456.1 hypothetical protein BC830DRAFT_1173540 [Chytriomyces sp. MP71]
MPGSVGNWTFDRYQCNNPNKTGNFMDGCISYLLTSNISGRIQCDFSASPKSTCGATDITRLTRYFPKCYFDEPYYKGSSDQLILTVRATGNDTDPCTFIYDSTGDLRQTSDSTFPTGLVASSVTAGLVVVVGLGWYLQSRKKHRKERSEKSSEILIGPYPLQTVMPINVVAGPNVRKPGEAEGVIPILTPGFDEKPHALLDLLIDDGQLPTALSLTESLAEAKQKRAKLPSSPTGNVANWSKEEVRAWVAEIPDCGRKLAQLFFENGIKGDYLLVLTDDNLKYDLSVAKLSDRLAFFAALRQITTPMSASENQDGLPEYTAV